MGASVALTNPSQSETATVVMTARDPQGNVLSTRTQPMGPRTQFVDFVRNAFTLGGETAGWIDLDCTAGQIAAVEFLRVSDAARSMFGLAAVEGQLPGTPCILPHYDKGACWRTVTSVVDPFPGGGYAPWLRHFADNGSLSRTDLYTTPDNGMVVDGMP